MNPTIDIDPTTTVHNLLKSYPPLEEILIGMAPPFERLRNPFLRNTIGKVATLKHAASVAEIDLNEMISVLRKAAGLDNLGVSFTNVEYLQERPKWFTSEKVIISIDESKSDDENKIPIISVLERANHAKNDEIIEWITSFLPAPGIDVMRNKNFDIWIDKKSDTLYKSYFIKRN